MSPVIAIVGTAMAFMVGGIPALIGFSIGIIIGHLVEEQRKENG